MDFGRHEFLRPMGPGLRKFQAWIHRDIESITERFARSGSRQNFRAARFARLGHWQTPRADIPAGRVSDRRELQ